MAAFVTPVFELGKALIEKLIPDPAAKADAQLKLLTLQQNGELAQLAAATDLAKAQASIDQVEAASPDTFVAGWRPFIGWVCGLGMAMQFIVSPFVTWGAALAGKSLSLPALDTTTLLTLLFGMLGLGTLRTAEKMKGVA